MVGFSDAFRAWADGFVFFVKTSTVAIIIAPKVTISTAAAIAARADAHCCSWFYDHCDCTSL